MPASSSEIQDSYYDHLRECARLLWSDAEAHAANCLPSRIVGTVGSTSGKGTANNYSPPEEEPPNECETPAATARFSSGDGCGNPYGGNPYGGHPFGGTPFGGHPFGGTPFGGHPFGGHPFGGTPFGGHPFGGSPYGGGMVK